MTRPTPGSDGLYVGAMNGHLLSFDRRSGQENWRYTEPGGRYDYSAIAVSRGRVFAPNYDGELYVVDGSSGGVRWRFGTEGRLTSPPVIIDDRVYLASKGGTVYALST
jgi:outer membrane protein assembly factor BamB